VLASSFHFSQGKEITAWESSAGELAFTVELGRRAEGEVRLALPGDPAATVDGHPAPARSEGQGVYTVAFTVNRIARVRVTYAPGT
jgi:hypothetical protein